VIGRQISVMATLETAASPVLRGWRLLSSDDATFRQGREYVATFLTEIAVLVSQILVYKLAARSLGVMGFSEYATVRRVVSLLQPVVLLGLGVGLPRYIGSAEGRGEGDRASRYLGATIRCVGAAVLFFAAALFLGRSAFAYLFFGKSQYRYLIAPLTMLLTGAAVHSVAYAWLRGRLAITRANLLSFTNLGLIPILGFLWFGKSVTSVLWSIGAAGTLVGLVCLAWAPVGAAVRETRVERKELLTYGLQRVPGDFILMALLGLPAILAAHAAGIQVAGFVAFGISVSSMIAAAFSALGIILLPKVSRNLGRGLMGKMRKEIQLLGWTAVVISLTLILIFEFFAAPLIHILLGGAFDPAVRFGRVAIVGALPLALYYVLRNVVDAFHERAVNTIYLSGALLVFLGVASLGILWPQNAYIPLWSFIAATTVLACLTVREVRDILQS
jgi:O-antigen/teichoic acid export membrane protein